VRISLRGKRVQDLIKLERQRRQREVAAWCIVCAAESNVGSTDLCDVAREVTIRVVQVDEDVLIHLPVRPWNKNALLCTRLNDRVGCDLVPLN